MIALRSPRLWFFGLLFAATVLFVIGGLRPSEARAADEVSEEEATQIKVAERFLRVLEKNPRRGTALDRVYGHHVEFGSLDKFVSGLKDKTVADAKDGTSWMLIGLFESQRGRDGNAVDAFKLAEPNRPTDALASYYLAQSLLRIGQNVEAVSAFQRAIERKPQRNDLLEIFQQLGRVHQRAQRTEEALRVWTRLESLFPDDPRVLEQIAVTLAEEGDNAAALERYERLAKLVKDDYRRTMYQIAVAELKIKGGQKDGGIGDLENVMKELDPDSWIYKDVRRRIDDVFLRSGDQDSLVKYYQQWIDAHPEDVEGMARLAKFLAQSARVPEATQWMEKALKLAPSRTDLRKSFIDQLVDDQRIPEAIRQFEQLALAAPGNPDFLRDWGKLVLKDKSQNLELRKKEVIRIWNQIVANRPDDAITTAQVADLFRQANMIAEAQTLYEKAVTLAPGDPQYREYLGEFYHIQKKPDAARRTWAAIADGKLRTAENVARLAEVYNSFGYLDQAVKEIADACRLAPKEFVLQMRSAEYHARATKYDEALTFLDTAEKLAASDDDRDALIRQRIEVFQSSQRMDDETKKLAEAVTANAKATPADWALLARYYEANRQWVEATESIENGLAIDPKSIPTLTAAARISESSGNYGQAADYSRRLADTDRRSRGDHLMNVARLEAQMGRANEALAAANELIVSAPGNTDNYEFLAQLCFRLGKSDEGLEALRKAVRINPNEPHLIMALASALADQLRTDEAIEVYWRAFDKSETVEDKTNLTQKLVPLYEQINQFDKLIERFERDRREEERRREMTICLAQAWQTSGDFGTARQELEQLLGEDSRDTNLLQQLGKLCEASGDVDAAIGYQRQLIAVAPGHETEFPLVAMLQSRGDRDEAMDILVRLTAREEDPVRLLRSIDSLLNQGAYEAVISITEPLLSQQREDWELLYREGVAWAKLEKKDEATTRFDRIIALTLPHDTLGLFATDEFKRAQAKAKSENLKGNQTQGPTKQSPLQLVHYSSQVQSATGLISQGYYGGNARPQTWTPREYGTARMAAFGWKLKFEQDSRQAATASADAAAPSIDDVNTVVAQVVAKVQVDRTNLNAVYDWLYVSQLQGEYGVIFDIARDLAKIGGREEQQFFLTSVSQRHVTSTPNRYDDSENAAAKSPLSEDDMALMMKCIAELTKQADENNNETVAIGAQIAYDSDGNAYMLVGNRYVRIGGGMAG
ncbi:MAG: tetratricopeptide repeat protein, partial [Planctomycetota bacterium]|nr:tetratricopeptide repeat protein [Planctomycetota bacterium]